jgi:hypothetical protein
MKKTRILGVLLLVCAVAMADLGWYDNTTKHWEVDTGALKCTFFYGCMFPVWFKNADGGKFPFFVFRDNVKHGEEIAFLDEERWATFTVIENTSLKFIIECRGNYCYGLSPYNVPDKGVEAIYRYELTRGKSDVKINVTLRKEAGTEYKVDLCSFRWRDLPFEKCGDIVLKEGTQYRKSYEVPNATLFHNSMDLWLNGHKAIIRKEDYEGGLFFLKDAEGAKTWSADSTELKFETMLCFGKRQKEVEK